MQPRSDAETVASDRQAAETVAALVVAYDALVVNGDDESRAAFVRFAALRLAAVLHVVTVAVDVIVTAMVSRVGRGVVTAVPTPTPTVLPRLEAAIRSVVEDTPPPPTPERTVRALREPVADEPDDGDVVDDEPQTVEAPEPEADDFDEPDDFNDEDDEIKDEPELTAEELADVEREIDEETARVEAEQYDDEPDDEPGEQDEPDDANDHDTYRRFVERARERQVNRLTRLVTTEIKVQSREAFAAAFARRGIASRWITRPGACDICTGLNGRLIAPGEPVPTSHPGCGCRVRPDLEFYDPYVLTGDSA